MEPAESPTPLLSLRRLHVSFGQQAALQHLDLDLYRGESLAVVGESGSGKTLLALSLMGLLPAASTLEVSGRMKFGAASYDMRDFQGPPARPLRGRQLAMVFQEPMSALNPMMRCGKQLTESLRLHRSLGPSKARAEALSLLRQVGLDEAERMYRSHPHALSGGQKQRLMIAMAISGNPQLLLADEPTTALDVRLQQAILRLLRDLQRSRGMSLLFITHDLGLLPGLADRVLVMYRGEIVEQGPVDRILRHPQHPYTRGLIACRPPLDRRLNRLPLLQGFLDPQAEPRDASRVLPLSGTPSSWTAPSGVPLLEVGHLNLQLGGSRRPRQVLSDISFELQRGESLGIVGASGSGKTSLGRCILQLLHPQSGSVRFRGRDMSQLKASELRHLRRHLQLVFQDPFSSLNPRLSVGEALSEPLWVHGLRTSYAECRQEARRWLERVGLPGEAFYRYPHEFSGGQRQRIGIARAMCLSPELLILDESVSALDVSVQAQILNLLKDLQDAYGFASLFITHDWAVLRFFCARALVLEEGRLVEAGPVEELLNQPRSPATRSLIEAVAALELSGTASGAEG